MEPVKKQKQDEYTRTLKWIRENTLQWEMICGHKKNEMTMGGCRVIMKMLQEESLYIAMFVFITAYSDTGFVRDTLYEMFMEMFIKEVKEDNGRKMMKIFFKGIE